MQRQISYFTKIDRTATPYKTVELQEVFSLIQNPSYKQLITLARKSGKTAPSEFTSPGTYYIDYDQYNSVLQNPYVVTELNSFYEKNQHDIIFYSEKFSPSNIQTRLNSFGVKFTNAIQIPDFYTFFEYKYEGIAFISFVWGSYDTIKQEKTEEKGRFKMTFRNLYTFVKSTKVPVVTWNAAFNSKRSLKSVTGLSGYIYMDVDDFSETSEERVYKILTDNGLNFVKAVWKSFGGSGFGFLVQVDGLTQENFKWNWTAIAKKFEGLGVKIDKATKDMTRINVLSYDENLFIRETCAPLVATTAPPENQIILKVEPIEDNLKADIIEQVVSGLYHNEENYNKDEDRLTYRFYQLLFSKLNHIGITFEEVMSFLGNYHSTYPNILSNRKYGIYEIENIGKNQYNSYSHQFGTVTVEKQQYVNEDYILLGVYKPFKGDITLKLNDLYEKAVQKETDQKSAIVYFSLIAKRTGISSADAISFIEKKFGYNPENKLKITKLYSNPKYPFGVDSKLKPTVAQKRREDYISKIISEGKSVKIYDETMDGEKQLPNIFNKYFLTNRITDKNAAKICRDYFKETNSYSIRLIDAIKYLTNHSEFHSIDRYAKHYGQEIYESYKPYSGIRIGKPAEEKKKISRVDYLDSDKKLSDLNLEIEDNTILWADTGMGKTTWACTFSDDKRIMLVPTVGALKNIETKYGAATFYEGNKVVCADDTLIVCTYSSAPKLFSLIQTWEGGLSNYTLIVDEQHNFAVSSAKDYRNSELNFVMDYIHYFKKRVFMTGTLFPVEHPSIKNLKIHRVKWSNQTQKNASIVWCEDKYKAVEKNLVRGKKNIIYLQDKRMNKQLGKLIDYLRKKNWNSIYLLNANEKNEPHFKKLVTTEYLEQDAEVVITTSVTVEAINILDMDVETVQFLTFENPRLMEQMVNRMRKKLPSNIYIYKKVRRDDEEIIDESWFNPISNQEGLISQSENLLKFLSKPKQKKSDSYDTVSAQKVFANHIFDKSALFRVRSVENVWDVDYLSIANKVFNDETNYSKNNFEYFKNILSEYGWVFTEDIYDLEKLTKEEKDSFQEKKEAVEKEMKEYSLKTLDYVSGRTITDLKNEVENKSVFDKTKYPDIEWDVRIKVLKLSKYMEFKDSCNLVFDLIENHNNSDEKFKRVMREIAIKIAKEAGVFEQGMNLGNKFSQSVVSLYFDLKEKNGVEGIYSKAEVTEWFNRRKRFNDVLKGVDGENAVTIFEKYFELTPVLKGTEVYYKIGGLNIINDICSFTNKFYEWAGTAVQCDLSFTGAEIADIMNSFRKDLPFLSKFKLDNKQAIKLVEDYISLKKTSKRNGKTVQSCYKVAELEPVLTKGYNIKINQEVINKNVLSEMNESFLSLYKAEKNSK